MTWFIDSIDRRAGMAFAVRLPADQLYSDRDQSDVAIYFIEPPDFAAKPISNRALSLGASKGGADPGLYIGEAAIPFASLDDVVEFVRRGYGAGGAGDGGGTGGPPRPRPERPEGPLRVPEPEEEERFGIARGKGSDGAKALLEYFRAETDRASDLKLGESFNVNWAAAFQGSRGGAIRAAALPVLVELLSRFERDDDESDISWINSFSYLMNALNRIGAPIDFWLEQLERRPDFAAVLHDVALLLGFPAYRAFDYWRAYRWPLSWTDAQETPFDVLCALPVPSGLERVGPAQFEHLGEFLSFAVSSNSWLQNPRASDVADLLWLCAAIVAPANDTMPYPLAIRLDDRFRAWRRDRADLAVRLWLSENLPQRLFARDVEALISATAQERTSKG